MVFMYASILGKQLLDMFAKNGLYTSLYIRKATSGYTLKRVICMTSLFLFKCFLKIESRDYQVVNKHISSYYFVQRFFFRCLIARFDTIFSLLCIFSHFGMENKRKFPPRVAEKNRWFCITDISSYTQRDQI